MRTRDRDRGWRHGMEQRDMGTEDTSGTGMETGKRLGDRGEDKAWDRGHRVWGTGSHPPRVPLSRLAVPTPGKDPLGHGLSPAHGSPPWPPASGKWPGEGHRWWPAGAGWAQSCSGVSSACCPHVPVPSQGCVSSGLASLSHPVHPGCSRSCFHYFCGMRDGEGPCSHTGQLWRTARTPGLLLGIYGPVC